MLVGSDPQTYQQYDPRLKSAMKDEFQSLQDKNTWELVPLPLERKVVQCKWIFWNEIAADGFDLKHKERLVAKGYY